MFSSVPLSLSVHIVAQKNKKYRRLSWSAAIRHDKDHVRPYSEKNPLFVYNNPSM